MEHYDAIIVGAGPAGSECARQLSMAGKQVLLIEKAKDFTVNNYSSGGAPLSIMDEYSLPLEVVSCYWNKLSLFSSKEQHVWSSPNSLGVVLDFKKLRQFLAGEAQNAGADFLLHCSYHSHEKHGCNLLVRMKDHDRKEDKACTTAVLVDATGSERKVLAQHFEKSKYVEATAIEYHAEVTPELHAKYRDNLCFYIGHQWMPQGYGWVFPMENNHLKIGIIRYFAHEKVVPHEDSYRYYMDRMLLQCFGRTDLPIIDKHGKTLYYSCRHREPHYHGNIIAIGDSISTLNPLAAEGIRHAMASSRIAAKYICRYLDQGKRFLGYPSAMKKYYGLKWAMSEMIMKKLYCEKNDQKLDGVLRAFKKFRFQEVLDLGFSYKFSKFIKFFLNYMKEQFK